jgi:hypothetical protein
MRAYGRYLQREFNRPEVREKLRALPVTHIAHRDEALPMHKVGAPCPMCDAPAT